MANYKTFKNWLNSAHKLTLVDYENKSDIMKLAIEEDYEKYKRDLDERLKQEAIERQEMRENKEYIKYHKDAILIDCGVPYDEVTDTFYGIGED